MPNRKLVKLHVKMPAIEVIEADAHHADVLAALHQTSFISFWTAAAFATMLTNPAHRSFVALNGDKTPAGFILVAIIAGEMEILTLAVCPSMRRLGVAGQLLKTAQEKLKPTTMFLEVARQNIAARKFYHVNGFAIAGERAAYYSDGDDAVIMRCALSHAQ